MKRLLFFFLTLLMCIGGNLSAQDLSFRVAGCSLDQLDRSAQTDPKAENDGDGYRWAIIKVTSDLADDDLQNFSFDFHNMRHERETRDGELWLFVQRNAKNVTIRRNGYKTVKYNLPFTVKGGSTYRMQLSVQAPVVIQRVLQFKVTDNEGNLLTLDEPIVKVKPADSSGDFEFWGTVDKQGTKDKLMETGVYLYEIAANNYKTATGRVSLVNGTGNHVETVKLTPNFGYLEIADDYGISGAEVYINNAKVGTIPYKSDRMECREDYNLMINNGELYKTYNATFAIRQGETTKLSPRLEANFAETTIKVDGNAEIYVNEIRKGMGSWTGPLKAGVYNVECKLTNHVTTKKQIIVKSNEATTFTIEKPKPIEGSLYISSTPSGAQIYIDGEYSNLTPCKIDHVLIGNHNITIRLANHKDETRSVKISENETQTINVALSDIATMTFKSNPSAHLYIDGKYKGLTPYKEDMPSGDYDIKLLNKHCRTYHKRIHLDGSNPEHTFTLPVQYQQENQFYLQPMLQICKNMGIGIAIGGYISNFNIEADYLYGFSKENIYKNYIGSNYFFSPQEYELTSMYMGSRFGYGFVVGTRWRFTPQLGVGYLQVSGYQPANDKEEGCESYVINSSIGIRADIALSRHIGLAVVPEYAFFIKKSTTYQKISDVSPTVKGWGQGFNLRAGLNIYF